MRGIVAAHFFFKVKNSRKYCILVVYENKLDTISGIGFDMYKYIRLYIVSQTAHEVVQSGCSE